MLGATVRACVVASAVLGVTAQDAPHAAAGCPYDKLWMGSTCPRVHSRPLVRTDGCCIGGGREGQCPSNCSGSSVTNASGTFCECQTPCDPPQPDSCLRPADFDECTSNPCQNGGQCSTPAPNSYSCACASNWGGENCDIPPPCDDPVPWRNVQHCIGADKCADHNDVSAQCLACLDGCRGLTATSPLISAGKPGVNNWCWYYNTDFPEICAALPPPVPSADCNMDCLAVDWRTVSLQVVDPTLTACPLPGAAADGAGRRQLQAPAPPHAAGGCPWDKLWIGRTCPRIHSRELVRTDGCCIGGGREGQCPSNCPGSSVTNASGTFCECQTPCDPPQPDECSVGPDFDECASSPCQNGGVCRAIGDTYTCDCLNEWLGENCDIPPPCDDPQQHRDVQHCLTLGHCQVVPNPADPTARDSARNDFSADCLSCQDGCSGKPGNWCWYYHTDFPEVCAAAPPTVCSTPDCLTGRWQDVYLQIADPSQAVACPPLPGLSPPPPGTRPPPPPPPPGTRPSPPPPPPACPGGPGCDQSTTGDCPSGCYSRAQLVGPCPPPPPPTPCPPPAPGMAPQPLSLLPAALASAPMGQPKVNYTGPANFTAVAECEETTNELGMKLGGLWVVFLIYDVGLSRSKKLPLHCSALCGPIFVLVALAQTLSIVIDLNDDFSAWPDGLQSTLLAIAESNNLASSENACGIGPVGKLQIAVAMPFLCLGTLLGGTVIYTILTAYKLPPAGELPRIFKNIITMMSTITILFMLPFLRAVTATQHCVTALDVVTGSVLKVMNSDLSVICYEIDDPAYADSVYAQAVALSGMGKLVPAAALLFVIVPSELLGFLSNKYRSHLNPKTETLVRKLGSWEAVVHLRKITFVISASEVHKVGGSAAASSVSALVYVLALALQVAVFPYEEGLTNLAEAFSLVAVLGILVLAPWLAMETGGLEQFLESTVLALLGLAILFILLAQLAVLKNTRKGQNYKPTAIQARIDAGSARLEKLRAQKETAQHGKDDGSLPPPGTFGTDNPTAVEGDLGEGLAGGDGPM